MMLGRRGGAPKAGSSGAALQKSRLVMWLMSSTISFLALRPTSAYQNRCVLEPLKLTLGRRLVYRGRNRQPDVPLREVQSQAVVPTAAVWVEWEYNHPLIIIWAPINESWGIRQAV